MKTLKSGTLGTLAMVFCMLAPAAQAQSAMLAQCRQVAQSFFGQPQARAEMQYNGQRTDGTHAVNGRIFLETRSEDFACSFARDQVRLTEFFAQGRMQNAAISGGSAGGAEFFTVTGISSGDVLNLRRGLFTGEAVIGALGNGDRVRNLGCRNVGNARWCRVGLMDDMGGEGWVNARYLKSGDVAMQLPSSPVSPPGQGATPTETVRFPAGASGTELTGSLAPGASRRYVINARNGQFLYARVAGAGLDYQIFNPDRSTLLGMMPSDREYRGQLWQTGDHVIEVINRRNGAASYNLIVGID